MRAPAAFDVRPRFTALHTELVTLLESLDAGDWQRQVSEQWRVADVAAHLLDTDLRRLSIHRDDHWPPPPATPIATSTDLVAFLDRLNAEWVTAARRLSPQVLIAAIETFGRQLCAFFDRLGLDDRAPFPVAWAGQDESPNWFDIAREYTEKWLHQQQIREAAGRPLLAAPEWLGPVLATFVYALPPALQAIGAAESTAVTVVIDGPAGLDVSVVRTGGQWRLLLGAAAAAAATVRMPEDVAWRLLGSRRRPPALVAQVVIEGDDRLAAAALGAVAVMA